MKYWVFKLAQSYSTFYRSLFLVFLFIVYSTAPVIYSQTSGVQPGPFTGVTENIDIFTELQNFSSGK